MQLTRVVLQSFRVVTGADMAQDYADMIAMEFSGRVDLVIGGSYGGLIVQYRAAGYDGCFNKIVIVVAACDISPEKEINYAFAETLAARHFKGLVFVKGLPIYFTDRSL